MTRAELCERLENCIRLDEHVTASPELLADALACILALIDENARLREALDKLETQVRYFLPYAVWTIGPESPGHHPTMPSAVGALKEAHEAARAALSPNPDQ